MVQVRVVPDTTTYETVTAVDGSLQTGTAAPAGLEKGGLSAGFYGTVLAAVISGVMATLLYL